MRLVCLSDTHSLHDRIKVPDGDVLIHAGDFCNTGIERDVHKFAKWIDRLPHTIKIVIAGNHDWFFQKQPELARAYLEPGMIYLQDSGIELGGTTFWGSPWQPWFNDWAFNLPRKGIKIREKWNLIPMDTDVLITHGPPHGVLDVVSTGQARANEVIGTSGPLGCEELAIRVATVKPKVHIFGHIHDGYGSLDYEGTRFVNACICDEGYRPVNTPIVIDV